jgi:hypothetical protein
LALKNEEREKGISSDNNSRPAGRQARSAVNREELSWLDLDQSLLYQVGSGGASEPQRSSNPAQKHEGRARTALERGLRGIFFEYRITHPQGRAARNNTRSSSTLRGEYPCNPS